MSIRNSLIARCLGVLMAVASLVGCGDGSDDPSATTMADDMTETTMSEEMDDEMTETTMSEEMDDEMTTTTSSG